MSLNEWLKYFAIMALATLVTFFFHEMSHWVAYELLGYQAGFTLNGASAKDPDLELPTIHRMITSAAGPVFTILQAVGFYLLLKQYRRVWLYPFLFLPFIMRLGAGWANRFKPNDEGRISLELGLNVYAISAFVVAFLLYLVVKTSRRNGYSLVFNLLTFLIAGVLLFGLVFLDSKYKLRIV
ncbi:hypothetical protein ABV409_12330 [Flagellimonas sp. DF-77]|uniref:hypothetical protein n=1 Tax=Flagellimonas algarum TaxID=3230298 RepID=UPI0033907C59